MTYLPISYLKGNLEYPNSAIIVIVILLKKKYKKNHK